MLGLTDRRCASRTRSPPRRGKSRRPASCRCSSRSTTAARLDPHLELASPRNACSISTGRSARLACRTRSRSCRCCSSPAAPAIAPLRSMLIEHLSRPTEARRSALIYSARSVDEFAFRPELAALESAGRISSLLHGHARRESEWQGRRGRISEALLKEALPSTEQHVPGLRPAAARERHAITADAARRQRRTNPDREV